MKTLSPDKIVIAVVSFLLGAFCFWAAQNFRNFHNKPSRDSITEHQSSVEDELDDETQFDKMFQNKFDLDMESDNFAVTEDDKYVYYEINSADGEVGDVDVSVDRGQVTITGQSTHKTQNGGSVSQSSSNFTRSFPAPPNVDAKKFEIEHKDNKVVIKFPKVKGAKSSDSDISI